MQTSNTNEGEPGEGYVCVETSDVSYCSVAENSGRTNILRLPGIGDASMNHGSMWETFEEVLSFIYHMTISP